MIKAQVKTILDHDEYAGDSGKYEVHSLYFDDYKDICAKENVAGERKRFKYRIRYYGDEYEKLWLEKKEKINNYCHKRKCSLKAEEFGQIIEGDAMQVFWNTDKQLLKEFCVDIATKRFLPRVIIDYEREAFVELITNVRITFDYNISASEDVRKFLSNDYQKIPLLEKNQHVLEVKFDDILPSYLKRILQVNILQQCSFSKYYLGRIAVQEIKRKYKEI